MRRELMRTRSRTYFVGVWLYLLALVGLPLGLKFVSGTNVEDSRWFHVFAVGGAVGVFALYAVCAGPRRCPRCKRRLRDSPNAAAEEKHLYLCRHCDIEWDTDIPHTQ